MDHQEEYHDPDYPGTSGSTSKEAPSISEDERVEKIRRIVRREFSNELEIRENEIMSIEQRMSTSRRMLHRLRYTLVTSYYRDQRLQLTASQLQDEVAAQHEPRARAEVSSLLREGQRRLHPSVRKLLGKQTVDLDEILFRSRAPRAKARKDYSAMVRSRNYTIAADTTKSLRPDLFADVVKFEDPCSSRPKKVPRHLQPKITDVVTLDEANRNQMKYRYRIIIGNTSKYSPPASRADRSTHKWLLYVRGPPAAPELTHIVTAVTVRLHHSYAPHHTVHIDKPPFHLSRRGWGEFPAQVELHFALPARNRPATVEHTVKLDRNYTGLQTLGAETLVDVWLYSTAEMMAYEYKENTQVPTEIPIDVPTDIIEPTLIPKEEPIEQDTVTELECETYKHTDSWLEFFSKDSTELDVDEMIIKPVKKVDEKNDLESLIETNVINKVEENHFEENHVEELNCQNVEEVVECPMNYTSKSIEVQEDLPNELLSQPTSPKKRIMKYMDPTTGKIYYLEMDRNLDLSKVQEIVINSKGNVKTAKISPIKPNGLKNVRKNSKKGVSLLKPEVRSLLKPELVLKSDCDKIDKQKSILKRNFAHIENDHCYLGVPWSKFESVPVKTVDKVVIKKEMTVFECLCSSVSKFTSVRIGVNYLLKKMPIVCGEARDPDYVKHFPYVVETEEKYWKMDFAKRRNIEWSRAKLINKLLNEYFNIQFETIWRTKQILIYSRLHGFYPVRTDAILKPTETEYHNEWSSWTDLENSRKLETNIKELYPKANNINSLTVFDTEEFNNLSDSIDLVDSDEEIEILDDVPVKVKRELTDTSRGLTVLPVESEEDRWRFLFIEKKSADIGVELRNEDVGSGYSYSPSSTRTLISLEHVYRGAHSTRLQALTARCVGTHKKDTYAV